MTRKKISQEGLKLLDEAGLKSLSMRKLGGKLGVEAMSLYNHVKNKADLLDSIHEMLLGELLRKLSSVQGDDWEETTRNLAHAFLNILRRHPGAIPLFSSRSAIAPGSLQFLDKSVGILAQAGLSPREALMTFQSLFTLIVGHAQFHYTPRDSNSLANLEAYQEYPHLKALNLKAPADPQEEFEFGLDLLLTGLKERKRS